MQETISKIENLFNGISYTYTREVNEKGVYLHFTGMETADNRNILNIGIIVASPNLTGKGGATEILAGIINKINSNKTLFDGQNIVKNVEPLDSPHGYYSYSLNLSFFKYGA